MLPTASSSWTTASSSRRARPSRCSTNRRRNALADFCAWSLPRMPPLLDRDGDSDRQGGVAAWRALETEVLPQGHPVIIGPEHAAQLQFQDYLIDKIRHPTRHIRPPHHTTITTLPHEPPPH